MQPLADGDHDWLTAVNNRGIYGNLAWFRDIPKYKDWVTIPQYFRKHGYMALTGGKIYHMPQGKFSDPIAWDAQYSMEMGTPFPPVASRYRHGMRDLFGNKILGRLIDWGPIEQRTEQTNDWKTADKAAQFLQQEHDEPFFLACGIYHPHLPWYVPQKYLDMYPRQRDGDANGQARLLREASRPKCPRSTSGSRNGPPERSGHADGDRKPQLRDLPPRFELHPKEKFADFEPPARTIPRSIGHANEWLVACKTGKPTTTSFDYSGPLTETVLLGNVAYRVGEKLQWDPENLKATNCPEADRFIRRECRKGWTS